MWKPFRYASQRIKPVCGTFIVVVVVVMDVDDCYCTILQYDIFYIQIVIFEYIILNSPKFLGWS